MWLYQYCRHACPWKNAFFSPVCLISLILICSAILAFFILFLIWSSLLLDPFQPCGAFPQVTDICIMILVSRLFTARCPVIKGSKLSIRVSPIYVFESFTRVLGCFMYTQSRLSWYSAMHRKHGLTVPLLFIFTLFQSIT